MKIPRRASVPSRDIRHSIRRDGAEPESSSAQERGGRIANITPRYKVVADSMLKIEPGFAGSAVLGICHADRAIVKRGYWMTREGDTLVFEVRSGPLERTDG